MSLLCSPLLTGIRDRENERGEQQEGMASGHRFYYPLDQWGQHRNLYLYPRTRSNCDVWMKPFAFT